MIDELNVYRIVSGEVVVICSIASDNAVLSQAIMEKNEISISIVTDYVPGIKVGDYIEIEGIKFTLNREPEFSDKSSVQHETTYTFEAPEYTLIDKILLNKITLSTKVTLTGKLRDWLELFIWNVNKSSDNPLGIDTGWKLGDIPDTDYMTLTFDGIDCRSLLSELASAYKYEYFVNDHTVNFVTRIENNRGLTFTQGCGKGLYEIEQNNIDEGDITTRIYPVGGTENVIPGEGDEEGRLILPEKYLENFSETSRVVEKKVVFEGVHPTFRGTVENPSGDNHREFTCSTIDFNVQELSIGDEARVNILTGDLMGKSFEFKWDNSAKKITLIYQEDKLALIDPETQTRPTIPSSTKYLRGGEQFNFTGIRLGDSYKHTAIADLREKAVDWLSFHSQKRVKFTLNVDYRYMRKRGDLKCGDLITVSIPERNINRIIRITSTEKNLKTGKITCVVSNYLTEKWEDKIEGQLSSMQATINGGTGRGVDLIEEYDERGFTNSNAWSSKRSVREVGERSLSKQYEDEAQEKITFKKGAIFKSNSSIASATGFSEALTIDQNSLIEEDESVNTFSLAVSEDVAITSFGGTLGSLENTDPSFDTVPDAVYSLQKKGGIYYPVVGGGEAQYTVRLINNLPSLNIYAVKNEPSYVDFTFTSQYKEGDTNVNTNERGSCVISYRPEGGQYKEVLTTYVQSAVSTRIDISKYLTSNVGNIMVKVTGEETGKTTLALTYSVQLTTLLISSDNFQWWNVFETNPVIPINIGGSISKILHVEVSGTGYNKSYDVNLGTNIYTETAYNYSLPHTGKTGVFNVSFYVQNTDGTIKTRTLSYNIIMILAGATDKMIAVNSVLSKAVNWTENKLFEYSMYDGGKSTTSATFLILKGADTIYTSDNDRIVTAARQIFSIPLEIETPDNTDFEITAKVKDGAKEIASILFPVDNSLGFAATSGSVFYLNPKTRSNSQANYKSIINEVNGSLISATWRNMNWGNDGWTNDKSGNNVLRLFSGASVDINYKPFQTESARVGKTIEIDFTVNNVTDYSKEILSIASSAAQFVGLKIYPDNIIMHSQALKNDDFQTINFRENERIRMTLTIMPDAYSNPGFNLCIIYLNGVKNREFNYQNNDYFAQDGNILIGSDYSDIDIYGIRMYDFALTSQGVLRNFINFIQSNTEKQQIQAINNVLDTQGADIDYTMVKDKFNTFVFDNTFPRLSNPNKYTGTLAVEFPKSPELNVSITNAEARGQGTSSMRYWWWNIQWRFSGSSVVTKADGTTTTGSWQMLPSIPPAARITAKKNFASSMQSHKMGSVNSIDDLYKAMGYTNEAMQITEMEDTRIAVYQEPFIGFEKTVNEEGQDVYTFMGLYTMGPDKGDKNTFGYDTKTFPGLISIEGSDNAPLCTLFRVPWNNNVLYNEDEEAWQYNGVNSWDFDGGVASNISKWIPAYNLAYQCSPRIKPFNGTLVELNAQASTLRNEPYEFWISKAGDVNQYRVFYFEASQGMFIPSDIGNGPVNMVSQLADKGYGLSASDLAGKTREELNTLFINARVQKFRKEAPQYWDVNDAIFARNWVEFHAGTDQRAKNTYPYCFGESSSKWKWRYDDMDTIFDTDNQGQSKKPYYVETQDKYSNGAPVWNGETSNFWNLIDLSFGEEIISNMRTMLSKMESLGGLNQGDDFDKLYAYFDKYYFSKAQKYFPINLYNADAKFTYETAKLAYIDGRYTNDTDPITQSLGDHFSAEQRWIMRRIVYMMSKYSFGLFSASGTDNITVRASGNTIRYDLTPSIDLYPAIANGTSIIRGSRTKAGEVCTMMVDLAGSGDQQNTIQGASYLQDIGDWHDKNVTGSMIVQGKMLREIRLGSKTQPITISISSLTISNCASLQKLVLSRISTLGGSLNISECTHLKEVYADGTKLSQIVLPKGGGLELIEYSSFNQYINLQNFPLLKQANVNITTCKDKITDLLISNCEGINPIDFLYQVYNSQLGVKSLKRVRCTGFENTVSDNVLIMLHDLANGEYKGLDSNGIEINGYPVLEGKIYVNEILAYEMEYLANAFPSLTIVPKTIIETPEETVFDIEVDNIGAGDYLYFNTSGTQCVIEWGDGTSDIGVYNGNITHKYNAVGVKRIRIRHSALLTLSSSDKDTFVQFSKGNITNLVNLGKISSPNCLYLFQGCTKLKSVQSGAFDNNPHFIYADGLFKNCSSLVNLPEGIFDRLINVVSFAYCFQNCPSLKYIPRGIFSKNIKSVSFAAAFQACINLESIPSDIFAAEGSPASAFNYTFHGCSALTSIPVDLFIKCKNATTFTATFQNCSKITAIPPKLFEVCTKATNFDYTFNNCIGISSIPAGLFDNCPGVTTFNACFQSCVSLSAIPAGLFDTNTKVVSFRFIFIGCTAITSIPENLFKYNTEVTTFESAFMNTGISAIPVGLFDTNTKVTNFTHCFYGCNQLASIPAGLFDNNILAENFYNVFNTCSKLAAIPAGLFRNNVLANTFEGCFAHCISLTSIPEGLFSSNTRVTSFLSCFNDCRSIIAIPSGLFDSNVLVTSFSSCFNGCIGISSIPEGLFKYNTEVISFNTIFANCQISQIPEGLFDTNKKVIAFFQTFYGLRITSIPQDLFRYNTLVESFGETFCNCSFLKSIPDDLFRYNTLVESLDRTFFNCTYLKSIPDDLFKYNTLAKSFSACFNGCAVFTAIPTDLFKYNVLATDFSSCFNNCRGISSIPAGLFDNCPGVTTFHSCFQNCVSLSAVPEGLFDNHALVTDFQACFYICTNLISFSSKLTLVDSTMFSQCAKLVTLQINNSTVVQMTNISALQGTLAALQIKVPASLVDSYKVATNWNKFDSQISAI